MTKIFDVLNVISYFSFSSLLVPSVLGFDRSETGAPRALIKFGRALVLPPVAAWAAAVAAAEAPFSLPLGGATPPLPGAGFWAPFFFGFLSE